MGFYWLFGVVIIILSVFIIDLFIFLFEYFVVNFYSMTLYYISLFLMAHYFVIVIWLIIIIHSLWFHKLILIYLIIFTFVWFWIFIWLACIALSTSGLAFLRHCMMPTCIVFWNHCKAIFKCAINIFLIVRVVQFKANLFLKKKFLVRLNKHRVLPLLIYYDASWVYFWS